MTVLHIALCIRDGQFSANRAFEPELCSKLEFGQWMPQLAEQCAQAGIVIETGDMALARIQSGEGDASKTLVIDERRSAIAESLIAAGCEPFILTGFESPLWDFSFLDNLSSYAAQFRHRILFRGFFEKLSDSLELNETLYYPSWDPSEADRLTPWESRRIACLIATNKYYYYRHPISFALRHHRHWKAENDRRQASPTRRLCDKHQLHSVRLDCIHAFGRAGILDLHGRCWEKLKNLPLIYHIKLHRTVRKLNPQPLIEKMAVLENYRFNVCLENVAYPGYVTEKIIDCFRAGTIPLYLGAPDIVDFVPADAYIDLSQHRDLPKLARWLANATAAECAPYLAAGQRFLASEAGHRFSHQYFAKRLFDHILARKNEFG